MHRRISVTQILIHVLNWPLLAIIAPKNSNQKFWWILAVFCSLLCQLKSPSVKSYTTMSLRKIKPNLIFMQFHWWQCLHSITSCIQFLEGSPPWWVDMALCLKCIFQYWRLSCVILSRELCLTWTGGPFSNRIVFHWHCTKFVVLLLFGILCK